MIKLITMKIQRSPINTVLLASVAVLLLSIDVTKPGLSATVQTEPLLTALSAILFALAMMYLMSRLQGQGWKLGIALFLGFYSLNTLLVAVEAVYMSDVLPPSVALKMLPGGAFTAALFTLAAVYLFGRWETNPEQVPSFWADMRWFRWVIGLLLCGVCWVILYVLFGSMVFRPLANLLSPAEAQGYFAQFDSQTAEQGLTVLGFQVGRGILWALLTLPLLRLLKGNWLQTGLRLGAAYAAWMGANLLLPTGLPAGIQTAHLVEVAVENFVFGMLVAWFFTPRRRQAPEV